MNKLGTETWLKYRSLLDQEIKLDDEKFFLEIKLRDVSTFFRPEHRLGLQESLMAFVYFRVGCKMNGDFHELQPLERIGQPLSIFILVNDIGDKVAYGIGELVKMLIEKGIVWIVKYRVFNSVDCNRLLRVISYGK